MRFDNQDQTPQIFFMQPDSADLHY